MSQAEPLPFVESPASRTGTVPGALPEVRTGRAAKLGIRFTLVLLIAIGLGVLAAWEMRTFGLEAYLFHNAARGAAFEVRPGDASWDLPAPSGPYDRRMGYTDLRKSISLLQAQGFDVVAQARSNEALERIASLGLFPPYREKPQGGTAHHRPRRCAAVRGVPAVARLRELRRHPARAGPVAALHREPRAARRGDTATQSGRGMGSPAARAYECHGIEPRGRQHARDPDREVPPLARGHHQLGEREAAPDVVREPARLSRQRADASRRAARSWSTT